MARALLYMVPGRKMKSMRRTNIILGLLIMALALPSPALAQGKPRSLADQEQERALLLSHKGRLEARLADQVRRIGRLKQNAPGVRRNFQLGTALRQNRKLAEKLGQLQQRINGRTLGLTGAYTDALNGTSDAQRKARLQQRLAALRAELGNPGTQLVTDGKVNPMDSPEDLEEKADLLDDSREKLKRQLTRVKEQLKRLEHRKRLRRHGRAADDAPFDENTTTRTTRVKGSSAERSDDKSAAKKTGGGATNYNGNGKDPNEQPTPGLQGGVGTPAPPKNNGTSPGAGSTFGDSAAGLSSSSVSSVGIRDVTDPDKVRELTRPNVQGGNLEQRIAALEKADKKLRKVLKKMSARSAKLRSQAQKIRNNR